jgi:hypothetical protein
MYRKRQRGGNFKGKKYQRSKPRKQNGGGKFIDFARTMEDVGRHIKKTSKAVHGRMYVQKGGGMRRPGPPRRRRNTIPNANYVMYHR